MTRSARRSAEAVLALLLLTGCPAGRPPPGSPPRAAASPAVPPAGPPVAVRAAVDLSVALPGTPATATAAVPGPDGGADVVVTPERPGAQPLLVRVDARGVPVARVALGGMTAVWDLHGLPDGAVLVSGDLAEGGGFVVVDPGSGAQRERVVPAGGAGVHGGSVLSPDGHTVYLLLIGASRAELVAVDVATGTPTARRELDGDVGALSAGLLPVYAATLVPRFPDGVGIVFDARPRSDAPATVPAVLEYSADLVPTDGSGLLAGAADGATVSAAVAGTRATLFLAVSRHEGAELVALPPGSAVATALVRLTPSSYGYALAVDPWQGWAVTPAPGGVLAENLATGGMTRLDLDCTPAGADVRGLTPSADGHGVLVTGRCGGPADGRPALWDVGL